MPLDNPEDKKAYDRNYYQTHHYSVLSEAPSHFQIQHADGTSFKVPKKGLSAKTLTRISALPKVGTGKAGSAVPRMAAGGTALDALLSATQGMVPNENPPEEKPVHADVPAGPTPEDVEYANLGLPVERAQAPSKPGLLEGAAELANKLGLGPVVDAAGAAGAAIGGPFYGPINAAVNAVAGPPNGQEELPIDMQRSNLVQHGGHIVSKPAPTSGLPERAPGFGVAIGSKIPGEEDVAKGILAKGIAESEGQKHEAQILQMKQEGLQKISDDTQGWLKERSARSEQLFSDIMNEKIDPQHYWNSKTTGQRISASIAMVLGGMSAGLTGGENPVMKNVNLAIDRDIEAQRANLGKKQTLLSHYMAETKDMLAAKQLVKADYLDISAAKLMQAAKESGSQEVLAQAQIEGGKWKASAFQLRSEIAYKNADMAMKGLDYAIKKKQFDFQLKKFAWEQDLLNGMSGQGDQTPAAGGAPGGLRGGIKIPRGALEALPEWRDRAVQLADGTYAFGNTTGDAKEANTLLRKTAEIQSALNQYSQLLEKHADPYGGGIWNPFTRDYGTADSLHATLLGELNKLQELQRLTNVELGEIYTPMVPSLLGPMRTDAARGKLAQLQRDISDHTASAAHSLLTTKLQGI